MKSTLIGAGVLSLLALTTTAACGGNSSASQPAVPSEASNPVVLTSSPSPTVQAYTDSDLRKMAVTAKDLGKPWKFSGESDGAVTFGETYCPTPQRAIAELPATGRHWVGFYEGKTGGAAIELAALTNGKADDARDALDADLKKCAHFTYTYGGTKFTSVDTKAGPTKVAGADQVVGGFVRTISMAKTKQIVSVNRVLVVRKGQVLVITGTSDYSESGSVKRDGFDTIEKLVVKQVAKIPSLSSSSAGGSNTADVGPTSPRDGHCGFCDR